MTRSYYVLNRFYYSRYLTCAKKKKKSVAIVYHFINYCHAKSNEVANKNLGLFQVEHSAGILIQHLLLTYKACSNRPVLIASARFVKRYRFNEWPSGKNLTSILAYVSVLITFHILRLFLRSLHYDLLCQHRQGD